MKTLMIVLGILGAFTPAVATATSQETATEFFCGVVLGVDASKRLLSVEEASLDADKMTFTIAADADVRRGSATIGLADIRVGDPVSVEYENTATGPVAQAVKVITAPETD